MSPEEFRVAGHTLIDWIADYREQIEARPVRADVQPGWVRSQLSAKPPETAEPFAALLDDLEHAVVPGITQVQHPMHFGWFPSNASLASVLGDIASSGLGTLGISWESCPALTEVEEVVVDWLRQLTGLSSAWHGTIHDTASTACLTALIAARERATGYGETRGGLQDEPAPLIVYTTDQAHSSVEKAALLAGFGRDNVRTIAVEPADQSMRADALARAVERDIADGNVPCVVIASVGTTGVTAIDPVADIASVTTARGIWLHVDAAMAGTAMLLPECRWMWDGVEDADSLSWNPHKWMGTILDCSVFYVRDPEHLIRVMSTNPTYLQSSVDGQVTQYRDWGIPLGRRFRALKLLFHLRLDGPDAIIARLRRDLENAQWLAREVAQTPDWHVVTPTHLQTVCIVHEPPGMTGPDRDNHTQAWVGRVNASGRAFLSTTHLRDRLIVRVSIGVEATTLDHVQALWRALRDAAEGSGVA